MTKISDERDALADQVAALEDDAAHVTAVERGCSSIPVEWVEVGGVRVGLDSAGSAVRVELPAEAHGWDAETVEYSSAGSGSWAPRLA